MKKLLILGFVFLIISVGIVIAELTPKQKFYNAVMDFQENPTNANALDMIITMTNYNSQLRAENKALQLEINKLKNDKHRCQPCPNYESCPSYPLGDANHDGKVDVLDQIIIRNILG